jgi:hypothetical protein
MNYNLSLNQCHSNFFIHGMAIFALSLLISLIPSSSQAQETAGGYEPRQGARWVMPCGGPCVYELRILQIQRYASQNLVRALTEVILKNGKRREWLFAYCDKEVLGEFGYSSDGSDAQLNPVFYYPYGEKLEWDGGSTGNRYSRWRILCNY